MYFIFLIFLSQSNFYEKSKECCLTRYVGKTSTIFRASQPDRPFHNLRASKPFALLLLNHAKFSDLMILRLHHFERAGRDHHSINWKRERDNLHFVHLSVSVGLNSSRTIRGGDK